MRGYLLTKLKNECFGCGSCYQVCPKKAIQMKVDAEGFLYPTVDTEKCIRCNLCHKACPAEHLPEKNEPMQALAGFVNDSSIRKQSASGGAFKAIVKCAAENAHVYGVEWSSRNSVKHSCASRADAYSKFSKSKYIQSDTNETFMAVKSDLDNGIEVVYVGTPCQLAGLKSYLGKYYQGLLSVDLVCHGVPSSAVLERYFQSCEKRSNTIVKINFREKAVRNGKLNSKCAVIEYSNGKRKIVDYDSSGFLRGFANGLFFRPSCATCPFACSGRVSDLTIGDAWGIEHIDSAINPHEGVSLILANTEKGALWARKLDAMMQLASYNIGEIVSGNGRLKNPDKGHKRRAEFFERYQSEDFEKLVQDIIPRVSNLRKIAYKLKMIIKG